MTILFEIISGHRPLHTPRLYSHPRTPSIPPLTSPNLLSRHISVFSIYCTLTTDTSSLDLKHLERPIIYKHAVSQNLMSTHWRLRMCICSFCQQLTYR